MSKNISLLVSTGGASSQAISLDSNNPARIKIQEGHQYILKNQDNNHSPQNVTLKRHGNDLHVIFEGDTDPAIVIDDYYVSGNHQSLLGIAEDGQLYSYITSDALGEGYMLADEGVTSVALGGSSLGDSSYLFESVEYSDGLMASWPWFLGAAAIGGIGYAIYDNNKDDDSSSSSSSQPAVQAESQPISQSESQPESQSIAQSESEPVPLPTPDEAINVIDDITTPAQPVASSLVIDSQSGSVLSGTKLASTLPTFSGEGEPGSVITFMDDATVSKQIVMAKSGKHLLMADNATVMSDSSYVIGQVVVGADGKWSFTPDKPLSEGSHHITMIATDKLGNQSTVTELMTFEVDITAPETPVINTVLDSSGDLNHPILLDGITREAKPIITGQGEPKRAITITDHGEVIGHVIADEYGNWTFTSEVALSEGAHSICVAAADGAGNGSQISNAFVFNVDTLAPEQPVISNITDDKNPSFVGEGEPNSTVTIFDNGVLIGQASVSGEGQWVFTPKEPLSEGAHSITVCVTDRAGNVSEPSAKFEFISETTSSPAEPMAPTIESVFADFRGDLNNGTVVNYAMPTLKGTAEQGSVVTIFDNGTILGSAVADSDGKWSFTPATELSSGEHIFTAALGDAAGNTGTQSSGFTVIIDPELHIHPPIPEELVTPTIESVSADFRGDLNSGAAVNNATPTLKGMAQKDDIVTIFDNGTLLGSTIADSDGKWSFTPAAELSSGEHIFTAAFGDGYVTGEQSAGFMVIVDPELHIALPPVLEEPVEQTIPATIEKLIDDVGSIIGEIAPHGVTDDVRPEIVGRANAGNIVNVYGNDGLLGSALTDADGNWSLIPTMDLAEGTHRLSAIVMNPEGPIRDVASIFEFTVDTIAPEKPLINFRVLMYIDALDPNGNPYGAGKDSWFGGFYGQGEPGSTIIINDNGQIVGQVIADAAGKWEFIPQSTFSVGNHDVYVTAMDKAGNISEPSNTLTFNLEGSSSEPQRAATIDHLIDDVGSIIGTINAHGVTDDVRPEIVGRANAGNIVNVYGNDGLLGSALTDADGNWSLTPTMDLAEGTHRLSAIVMNPEGPIRDVASVFEFTIDITAPEKPSINIDMYVYPAGHPSDWDPSSQEAEDHNPWFIGKGEPGSTITITDNGQVIGQTIVDASGNWKYIPQPALSGGEHNAYVTAMDKAGNISEPSNTLTFNLEGSSSEPQRAATIDHLIDDVGSIIGEIAPHGVTDDVRPEIVGRANAGNIVNVYGNDGLLGSALTDADGNWSLTPTMDLAEGTHRLSAIIMNPEGPVRDVASVFEFTIDITAPAVPTIDYAFDNVGHLTGMLKNGDVTDDSTPTLHGSAIANSVVDIYLGGEKIGSVTADAEGKWAFTTTPIDIREHVFTVTATDANGKVSESSQEFRLAVDNVHYVPTTIVYVIDSVGDITGQIRKDSVTDDPRPYIAGTADKHSIVEIYDGETLLGSTRALSDGEWNFTPPFDLAQGKHSITAIATDIIGYVYPPSNAFSFTVDTTPPAMPTIESVSADFRSDMSSGTATNDVTPTLNGVAEKGSLVTIFDGNVKLGSVQADSTTGKWSFTPSFDLTYGDHTFTALSVDKAGNESTQSLAFVVVIDADICIMPPPVEPPEVPDVPAITSLVDNVGIITGTVLNTHVTDDATPTLSGTAIANGIVTIYNNDVKFASVTADADGKWSFTPETALPDDVYSINIDVTNAAGQTSGKSGYFYFNVDTIAPDASTAPVVVYDNLGENITLKEGDVTDDCTPSLSGMTEAGNIVTIYDHGVVIGSTICWDGTWKYSTSDAPLADGEHQFTVTTMDKAGNVSEVSSEVNITIDTSGILPSVMYLSDNVGTVRGHVAADGSTDDLRPWITGSGKIGSVVMVYDDGVLLGSSTVGAWDGQWYVKPYLDLAEGKHSITLVATDKLGNHTESISTFDFFVDTIAPAIPTIESAIDNMGSIQGLLGSGGTTDDSTPTLTGKAEVGSIVKVYDGSVLLGSATVDSLSGEWSFTPAAYLAKGEHQFHVTATDTTGNNSQPSENFSLILEYSQPDSANLTITNVHSDGPVEVMNNGPMHTGDIENGGAISYGQPLISGTGFAGDVITLYSNGYYSNLELGSTTVDANGKWSLQLTTYLQLDDNELFAVGVDAQGNVTGTSAPYAVTFYGIWADSVMPDLVAENDSLVLANVEDEGSENADDATTGTLLHSTNLVFFGSEGTDTLILNGQNEQLKPELMQDKLTSVEISDLSNGNNIMTVSLNDVLRVGTEELAINSGNKAIVVNGDEDSTLQLEETNTQLNVSQSEHQYAGNTYDVWINASSTVEVLLENTVHVML